MVRKITHIILSLVLFVTTIGVTISMHYCGGELVSTAINQDAPSCCDMGGCCENESIQIAIDDDFVSPFVIEETNITEISILFPIAFLPPSYHTFDTEISPFNMAESPPPLKESIILAVFQSYRC